MSADGVDRLALDVGVRGVTLDVVGLSFAAEIDFQEWEHVGFVLGKVRDATAWAVGDWLNAGERMFGEDRVVQAAEVTGRKVETLLEYARVARIFQRHARHAALTFTAHQVVATLDASERDLLLQRAEQEGLSARDLRAIRATLPSALPARRRRARAEIEILEHEHEVVLALLEAAEPADGGWARVPEHVLDRLANAAGVQWR